MELELNAEPRTDTGNKLKALREKGFIPAIVYPYTKDSGVGANGPKALPIQVNYQEFSKVFEIGGESTILKLKIQNPKSKKEDSRNVLIHDVAKDPVEDKIIHIDFYQVRMDKAITAEVALVFEGEAPAVKNLEGVLIKNITEIEVEALPKDLPHEIKVDISCLESFDDHIKIKDLKLPEGVKVLVDSEEVIASVIPPRTKEELEELEEKVEEVPVEEVEKVEEEKVKAEEKVEEVEPPEAPQERGEAKSAEVPTSRDKGGKKE